MKALTAVSCESSCDSKRRVRVILISSVQPVKGVGGELLLYRHLIERTDVNCHVVPVGGRRSVFSRILSAAARNGCSRLVADWKFLTARLGLSGSLPKCRDHCSTSVVLTVAHGDGYLAAMRYARRGNLPLVSMFHDWWPDCARVHGPFQSAIERSFFDLHRSSSGALMVCNGMLEAIGATPVSSVLYPIASIPATRHERQGRGDREPFRVGYAGNLCEYGPMVGELLQLTLGQKNVRLEVRGRHPLWSASLCADAMNANCWNGFSQGAELENWLASLDALLVPMAFDPRLKRRMMTSFPSKLTEFAQYRKPIIVWGPEYCSAVKWAQAEQKALCVVTPNPASVVAAIDELQGSPETMARLSAKAAGSAAREFCPERIQRQLLDVLNGVLDAHCLRAGVARN